MVIIVDMIVLIPLVINISKHVADWILELYQISGERIYDYPINGVNTTGRGDGTVGINGFIFDKCISISNSCVGTVYTNDNTDFQEIELQILLQRLWKEKHIIGKKIKLLLIVSRYR